MDALTRARILSEIIDPLPQVPLLTPPYGYGSGDTITLRCAGPVSENMEEVMAGYSCYPPALPKIRACLEHSGRYDCTLQSNWFRGMAERLREDLEEIGIAMSIVALADDGRRQKKLTPEFKGVVGVGNICT
ncbi:hypothetical protein vBRpoSV10_191 [Ruegeria phage vB_RpoS-V10]|nr:hypothetical protein vBRpoSV10_191 [Ruegeria phage vB_RpoS-V10]